MTTIVWSTESVDTSAMLLAQTLDDVLFTKDAHEDRNAEDEVTDALKDTENQILFYGIVNMPEWFTEGHFDRDRMFNDPRVVRALLRRNEVINALGEHGVAGVQYIQLRDNTSYTRLRERLGRRFDLVTRFGMMVTATVDNADDFNHHRRGTHFACAHLDPVKKMRVFIGLPNVIDGGVIGVSITEKRQLTFFESLTYGASVDVRNHIQRQFDEGVLTEEMGAGRERQEAWTEQVHQRAVDINDGLLASLRGIADAMHRAYPEVDFCALDVIGDATGALRVTNCTASPGLTDDPVLEFVSDYYKELLVNGRVMTRERLARLIHNLSEEQVVTAARLLRREGVLQAAV